MKARELFDDIRYVGEAEGDKNSYSVFATSKGYLVLSPTTDGYYLNLVDAEAPDAISKAFAGKKVTSADVSSSSRRRDLFYNRFAALNGLYVMVALRRARKLKQRQGKAMVFKIR